VGGSCEHGKEVPWDETWSSAPVATFTFRGSCVQCVCGADRFYLRNVGHRVEWHTLSITVGTWPSQPL
jgi:hypothetical protein